MAEEMKQEIAEQRDRLAEFESFLKRYREEHRRLS